MMKISIIQIGATTLVVVLVFILLAVGAIGIIYQQFMQGYRSKITTDTYTESHLESDSTTEDATGNSDKLRESATKLLIQAEGAEADEQYQQATDAYEEAISHFEQAAAGVDNGSKTQLESEIEEARAALDSLTAIREDINSLTSTLQAAERSFKEAIARYAADERTVARIRFRQARDGFKAAQQTITESDTELLAQPIEVSFEQEATLPSMVLEELAVLEEATVETLAAVDIESITDLEADPENEEMTPAVVNDLQQSAETGSEETTLLTILSWWHEGASREFGSEAKLSQRYEQADYGFDQST